MKEIKKGGKRNGAGRKPTGKKKSPITLYVEDSRIEGMGGLVKAREQIYCFIMGMIALPDDYVKVGTVGIAKPDGTIEPLFKPNTALKDKKGTGVSEKEDKGGKGTRKGLKLEYDEPPLTDEQINQIALNSLNHLPEAERMPEGLSAIQQAVWRNNLKMKNKPTPITGFGLTKKEKNV